MNHPAVSNALRTGYPGGEPKYPVCPVCGCECETIFFDLNKVPFACDECVSKKSAWEVEECF